MSIESIASGAGLAPQTEAGVQPGAVNQASFLKLLVAQLQHQNPLDPADGAQFIAQLATFSQLEQSIAIKTDLAAIRAAIEAQNGPAAQV